MNFNHLSPRRATILILLGFGLFQLVAGAISLLFWVLMGDWRPYIPFIAGVAGGMTLLIMYMILYHNR